MIRPKRLAQAFTLATLAAAPMAACAADPVVTGDARVDHLLAQMTPDEKLSLIRGAVENPATSQGQAGYLVGVPRLGVPALTLADGPPGVLTRLPSQAETATMGLAATFSLEDARANGEVIAREARALGVDIVLQPFINIDRDITTKRAYNTYGEDPVLTGAIGASLIRGVQSLGVMAQAKHFVGYDTDYGNVEIDPQTLHEVYLAPFAEAVKADVSSIMCSYNKINGLSACGNHALLTDVLRSELGWKGFVTSDWGAVHGPHFLLAGLDMEMPGAVNPTSPFAAFMFNYFNLDKAPPAQPVKLDPALIAGLIGGHMPEEPAPEPMDLGAIGSLRDARATFHDLNQSGQMTPGDMDRAAGHVLYEIAHFGYLDHPPLHKVGPHALTQNAAVIEQTAVDAAVLLKNEGAVLPLNASRLDTVALIGPGAAQVVAIGTAGERSTGLVERQISPWAAIKALAPGAHPVLAVADDMSGRTIPAAALSHDGKPGLVRTEDGRSTTDAQIDFTAKSGHPLAKNTRASWEGTLTAPQDGEYWISLQMLGAAGAVTIDAKLAASAGAVIGAMHGDTVLPGKDGLLPSADGLDNARSAVQLTAGPHRIKVEVRPDTSGAPAQVRLAWSTPQQRAADRAGAIAAAKAAKTAVVFAWSRGAPAFGLPGDQDQLIEDIAAVNPNVVVVLNVSEPVALPWLGKVKGLLQMWYPGDEGGRATARILLGKDSPAGRLPFSWGARLADYPATDPAHPERSNKGKDGLTRFTEGVDVGYRWFDRQNTQPLFAFGYGQSYTRFEYRNLAAANAKDGGLDVSFEVKNTGARDSDEVPQVYLGAPKTAPMAAAFPVHALAGFARLHIAAGETRTVSIHVPARSLQYWSVARSGWDVAHGARDVLVGGSSRDLPLTASVVVP